MPRTTGSSITRTPAGRLISGFYIGRCDPCHALVTDVLAERNAVGFSGTNASGDLAIVNSEGA